MKGEISGAGLRQDGLAQGMLAGAFQGCGDGQQLIFSDTALGQDVPHLRLALGEGAGFVQHHRVHRLNGFQRLPAFDQDAVLGPLAGAHHDGGGGGQPQGTGAGDDQHRDKDPEGKVNVPGGNQPGDAGEQRNGKHHRHKDAGDLVRQPGNGGLGALGLLHQADDLGQGGVVAHLGGAELKGAGGVEGGGIDGVARLLHHRHALPGEGGFIHPGAAGHHHAIHRHPGAGAQQQGVAHLNLLDGDFLFFPVHQQDGGLGA